MRKNKDFLDEYPTMPGQGGAADGDGAGGRQLDQGSDLHVVTKELPTASYSAMIIIRILLDFPGGVGRIASSFFGPKDYSSVLLFQFDFIFSSLLVVSYLLPITNGPQFLF